MRQIERSFAIADPTGPGEVEIAVSVFLPAGTAPDCFLVCTPGGGYTREYWHPSNLDDSYSFATAMTSLGYGVVALDTLGSGESTRIENGDDLTIGAGALANHSLVGQLRKDILAGDLASGLPAVEDFRLVGVGHSLGGAIVITEQGLHASYDAIGVFAFTNQRLETMYVPHEREDELTDAERVAWAREHIPPRSWGMTWDELPMYFMLDRTNLRSWFHMEDVPPAVIAAEESRATVMPRAMGLEAIIPGVTAAAAAKIESPVFLVFGERDNSPDPGKETAAYSACGDITLFRLPGSAHCHNYASTRRLLWDRFGAWIPTVLRT